MAYYCRYQYRILRLSDFATEYYDF
eukprot:SAG11_NODE_27544_length_331_cov_1.107759_1_plen_24_part_01